MKKEAGAFDLATTVRGSGPVPHVRPGVHGPIKMGAALSNALATSANDSVKMKALEEFSGSHFLKGTAFRPYI
jgi:hypothetical protein